MRLEESGRWRSFKRLEECQVGWRSPKDKEFQRDGGVSGGCRNIRRMEEYQKDGRVRRIEELGRCESQEDGGKRRMKDTRG